LAPASWPGFSLCIFLDGIDSMANSTDISFEGFWGPAAPARAPRFPRSLQLLLQVASQPSEEDKENEPQPMVTAPTTARIRESSHIHRLPTWSRLDEHAANSRENVCMQRPWSTSHVLPGCFRDSVVSENGEANMVRHFSPNPGTSTAVSDSVPSTPHPQEIPVSANSPIKERSTGDTSVILQHQCVDGVGTPGLVDEDERPLRRLRKISVFVEEDQTPTCASLEEPLHPTRTAPASQERPANENNRKATTRSPGIAHVGGGLIAFAEAFAVSHPHSDRFANSLAIVSHSNSFPSAVHERPSKSSNLSLWLEQKRTRTK